MGAKTLTISLSQELLNFLEDNPTISPSKLFQSSLLNLQESIKHNPQLLEAQKELKRLEKVIERLQSDLIKATSFIEDKNLWGEITK